MKKFSLLLIMLSLSIFLMSMSGCKKNNGCKAGSGGDVTLHIEPQHHGIPIYSSVNYRDTAYIKYEAVDFPGPYPSNYDLVVPGKAGENFVDVSSLKCGQYFIFVTGFDTSTAWHIRVVGGQPLNFSETSGTKTIIAPVSE